MVLGMIWIGNAAMREAVREGAPAVDIDHVFLGLVATGGSAASRLLEDDVTLDALRSAAERVRHLDLADLGLLAPASPEPPEFDEINRTDFGGLPVTDRANRLMSRLHDGGPEDLLACLDEPSGTVRDILTEAGADVEALRHRADVPAARPGAVEPVNLSPFVTASRDQVMPYPIEQVFRAVTDARVVEQLVGDRTPTVEVAGEPGVVIQTTVTKRATTVQRFELMVDREPAGGEARAVWLSTLTQASGKAQRAIGHHGTVLDIRLSQVQPASSAASTSVHLTRGVTPFGRLAWAVRPVIRVFGELALPTMLAALQDAASRA